MSSSLIVNTDSDPELVPQRLPGIFDFTNHLFSELDKNKSLSLCYVDGSKAFNSVRHPLSIKNRWIYCLKWLINEGPIPKVLAPAVNQGLFSAVLEILLSSFQVYFSQMNIYKFKSYMYLRKMFVVMCIKQLNRDILLSLYAINRFVWDKK